MALIGINSCYRQDLAPQTGSNATIFADAKMESGYGLRIQNTFGSQIFGIGGATTTLTKTNTAMIAYGLIEFDYRGFNLGGSLATNVCPFAVTSEALGTILGPNLNGASVKGGAYLEITSDGPQTAALVIIDAGGNISARSTSTWVPTQGTRYRLEISFRFSSTTVLEAVLRVDGVTKITHTYTATSTADILVISALGGTIGCGPGSFKGATCDWVFDRAVLVNSDTSVQTDANFATWPLAAPGGGIHSRLMVPNGDPGTLSDTTSAADWAAKGGAAGSATYTHWYPTLGSWDPFGTLDYNESLTAAGTKTQAASMQDPSLTISETIGGISAYWLITAYGDATNRMIFDDGTVVEVTPEIDDAVIPTGRLRIHTLKQAPSGGNWTLAKLNALKLGARRKTVTTNMQITVVWAIVACYGNPTFPKSEQLNQSVKRASFF